MARGSTRERVFELADRLLLQSRTGWLPAAYKEYEDAVSRFIVQSDKEAAISLICEIDDMGRRGKTDRPLALIPAFSAFLGKFGETAELYLELFVNCVGTGGELLDRAPAFLKRAFVLDSNNNHVLWQLWVSYRHEWFPSNLRFSASDFEHESQCMARILSSRPQDRLALRVREWLETSQRPYNRSVSVPIPVWKIDEQTRPLAARSMRQILTDADP